MATSRPYAVNTGSTLDGTQQIGNIAIATGSTLPSGVQWWMGPDEDLGYVITVDDLTVSQSTPVGINAGLRFWRSAAKTDASFIGISNVVARRKGYFTTFTTTSEATAWLSLSGFPTTYEPYPEILNDTHTWAFFDYSDSSTIVQDESQQVVGWRDKLGTNRTLMQTNSDYRPLYSSSGITFDGTADYMRATGTTLTLAQPTTVYMVVKALTWTVLDCFCDGENANTGQIQQTSTTPYIRLYAGTAGFPSFYYHTVGNWGILSATFSGGTGSLQIDEFEKLTGTTGTNSMNGFTLAARGGTATYFANIDVKDVIVRDIVDTDADRLTIIRYLNTKYSVYPTPPSILQDGNSFGWWDSRKLDTITRDGSNYVSSWTDYLGTGKTLANAVGGTQPAYTVNGVEFGGTDEYLSTGSQTLNHPSKAYMVVKFPTDLGTTLKFFTSGVADTTAAMLQYGRDSTGNLRGYAPSAYGPFVNFPFNKFALLTYMWSGATSTAQLNFGQKVTGAGVTFVNPGGFQLGHRTSTYCNIVVKEVIYRTILDTAEDELAIQEYLYNKHIAPNIDYEVIDDGFTEMWYDYTNSGSITLTGTTGVTQWNNSYDVRYGNEDLSQIDESRVPELLSSGVYFDGVNDMLTGSTYAVVQPWTVYLVMKQHSWTNQDKIFNGNSNAGLIWQAAETPNIRYYDAGSTAYAELTGLTIGTWGVVCVVGNGASSLIQLNDNAPSLGTGTLDDNIITGLLRISETSSNVEFKEILVRMGADDSDTRLGIYNYFKNKHSL